MQKQTHEVEISDVFVTHDYDEDSWTFTVVNPDGHKVVAVKANRKTLALSLRGLLNDFPAEVVCAAPGCRFNHPCELNDCEHPDKQPSHTITSEHVREVRDEVDAEDAKRAID